MGKIALIVGPHGVGKSTLFNFAKTKGELIVFDGFELPRDNYDLTLKEDFLKYESWYIKFINENNNVIKQSVRDGIVVRSIEESSYYFHFYKYANLSKEYDMLFANSNNTKVDCVIYLDADYQTLCDRCEKDNARDMTETHSWYEYEYTRYVAYWTQYPGVKKINTKDKKIREIYEEVRLTLSNIV